MKNNTEESKYYAAYDVYYQRKIAAEHGLKWNSPDGESKESITRIDYCPSQGVFHFADGGERLSYYPDWEIIGFVRDEVAWKFSKTVKHGAANKINGVKRCFTHQEMRDMLYAFCEKNGYYFMNVFYEAGVAMCPAIKYGRWDLY